jgi:hypothetical protein
VTDGDARATTAERVGDGTQVALPDLREEALVETERRHVTEEDVQRGRVVGHEHEVVRHRLPGVRTNETPQLRDDHLVARTAGLLGGSLSDLEVVVADGPGATRLGILEQLAKVVRCHVLLDPLWPVPRTTCALLLVVDATARCEGVKEQSRGVDHAQPH